MRRFHLILLVVLVCVFFAVSVSAATYQLSYSEWLEYYDLADTTDNYQLWIAISNGIVIETDYPVLIPEDVWDAYYVSESNSSDSVDIVDTVFDDEPVAADLEAAEATLPESYDSEIALLSTQPVPTSSASYIQPQVVSVEYAPDADEGTLLSTLYDVLGKPVASYTYKVRTGSNSTDTYVTEHLDYDVNWLASFVMLALVIFCLFKLGGGLLCKE